MLNEELTAAFDSAEWGRCAVMRLSCTMRIAGNWGQVSPPVELALEAVQELSSRELRLGTTFWCSEL